MFSTKLSASLDMMLSPDGDSLPVSIKMLEALHAHRMKYGVLEQAPGGDGRLGVDMPGSGAPM